MSIITIKPVTRVEGHAKVDLHLDDAGKKVEKAFFRVEEFRGFEKILEGRPLEEAPHIVPRICGICPVSHHLSSAKACDAVLGVEPPETGTLLRELMHMGQTVHSHALHFFFLAAPDFLFPTDLEKRNVIGIVKTNPELAKKAITLRKMGQDVVSTVGGRAIHPITAVPGGVTKPITEEERKGMLQKMKQALVLSQEALGIGKKIVADNMELIKEFAPIETNYGGLTRNGVLDLYDGKMKFINPAGQLIEEFPASEYMNHIDEHEEDFTSIKFPYLKSLGFPKGTYRVNTLARLNVADKISTPIAQKELESYRKSFGRPAHLTLLYHYARLIELIYACEKAMELLENSKITGTKTRTPANLRAGEGVGIIEAPRGMLIHHYKTNGEGIITKANIIVATQQNNYAINESVKSVAQKWITSAQPKEELLNRVEMAIRAYDPCLSCSTHLVGRMPLEISVYRKGKVAKRIRSF